MMSLGHNELRLSMHIESDDMHQHGAAAIIIGYRTYSVFGQTNIVVRLETKVNCNYLYNYPGMSY